MNRSSGFLAWFMDPKRRGPMLIAPAITVLLLVNIIPLMWSFGLSFFKFSANPLKLPKFSWFYSFEKVLNTRQKLLDSIERRGERKKIKGEAKMSYLEQQMNIKDKI